ncbi:hypothetical protein C8R43DRAFT_1035306 [Mycena crocata]|nr:hypothetical protein C8R43DRAFT_1035306 [Mycena crocata]
MPTAGIALGCTSTYIVFFAARSCPERARQSVTPIDFLPSVRGHAGTRSNTKARCAHLQCALNTVGILTPPVRLGPEPFQEGCLFFFFVWFRAPPAGRLRAKVWSRLRAKVWMMYQRRFFFHPSTDLNLFARSLAAYISAANVVLALLTSSFFLACIGSISTAHYAGVYMYYFLDPNPISSLGSGCKNAKAKRVEWSGRAAGRVRSWCKAAPGLTAGPR